MPPSPVSEARSIFALASIYIVRMLGLFMVLPVLALAGDEYGSQDVFLLGLALGIYGLTQAALQIPFGMLSDRFGRKPLIVIGLLVFMAGSMIAAAAEDITGLIIGRALQGAGAIASVIMAMVGDLTTEQNRSKAFAAIGAAIGLAFALSLVLGPILTGLGGVRLIFWVSAGLAVLALLILLALVPKIESQGIGLGLDSIKRVLVNPDLARLNMGILLLHAVLTALFIVFPLRLLEQGVPSDTHSWIYLAAMSAAFVVMVPMMVVGEKRGLTKTLILLVLLGLAGLMLVMGLVSSGVVGLVAAMVLFFIGFNYLEASLPSLMSKTVDANLRGTGSGVFSTCQFLGAALGGVGGGWLMSAYGSSAVFIVAAFLFLVWCLVARQMVLPKGQKSAAENVIA